MAATAEPIARVVDDLRAGRVRNVVEERALFQLAMSFAMSPGVVVDATAIYDAVVERDNVMLYEDHPCIAPPFTRADFCYVNGHGNVHVMTALAIDHADGRDDGTKADVVDATEGMRAYSQPDRWVPAEPIEWGRVRWTIDTFVWVGGYSDTSRRELPTTGPAHMWRFAVYEDGTPADLHWVQLLEDQPLDMWDNPHLVLLGALNFMNCRNVELVEPKRPRGEARRLARIGVPVHTINVFPAGRSTRSAGGRGGGEELGSPHTPVRGHFANYGPKYNRGLLFGKYEGRFFIPQHARGSVEHGERQPDYRLRT